MKVDDARPHVAEIAAQYAPEPDAVQSVTPYGAGNINDTYLVRLKPEDRKFILQRINQSVFRRPELIMANLRAVDEHIAATAPAPTAIAPAPAEERRWELPRVLNTREGGDYIIDEAGDFWRALSFIEHATAYLEVRGPDHAAEAGYALGRFQAMINDLDVDILYDTLPGFHIIPSYLSHYDEVVASLDEESLSPQVHWGMAFIAARRDWAPVLQEARDAGRLRQRPIHGDPKIDNIMIDDETGRAVSIIDLDTVKPGLVQYDIGDCLRSSCNPLGEHTQELDAVTFELDLCEAILQGYLPQVESFYTDQDYAYLYDAVRVLAFEMGLRFFTDYLEGDVYFKTRYPKHNLMRGLVQFRLMESIEAQERGIRHLIDRLVNA